MHFPSQMKGRQKFLPSPPSPPTHTCVILHTRSDEDEEGKERKVCVCVCVQVPKSRIAIRCSEACLFPAPAAAATRTAQPPT